MLRSLLFLPGNTPNILINGDTLGADALIFDLEDAVAPAEKDAARLLVRNALQYLDFSGCTTIVRVNALDSPFWQADLESMIPLSPQFIMPPKTSCAADVLTFAQRIRQLEQQHGLPEGNVRLILLIESALGVENAFAIASASPCVAALFLGAEDLSADLRCQRSKAGTEIYYARCRLIQAARAAGIEVYDTPFTDIDDEEGLIEDAQYARSLGFSGKAAISPRHLPAINAAFSPTMAEITYAKQVMQAIAQAGQQGRGVVALYGKMIDAPIVARARQVLEAARELGMEGGEQG